MSTPPAPGSVVFHNGGAVHSLTLPSRIYAVCEPCDQGKTWPNKGIGRANFHAWLSRHQHPEAAHRAKEQS